MAKVEVIERVLGGNDEVAASLRAKFDATGLRVLDMIGSPGSGKTALLEATMQALPASVRVGVLVGDLATRRDADRIAKYASQVVQINTAGGCHLEAHHVEKGVDALDLEELDLLVIENVGNLICPVGWDLGQHAKVGLFSVAEGDDKPGKHPPVVLAADALVLTKADLLPYVPFDQAFFEQDIRQLNPTVPILETAAIKGELGPWMAWLEGFLAG
jgi:hydrogenase nickel incorporation protein HypB